MSFVPAQFSQFTAGLDFDKIRNDTSSSFNARIRTLRTPRDFFDLSRVSKPLSMSHAQSRIVYNISHFKTNYFFIIALVSIYTLLTNLALLFVILFGSASCYGVSRLRGGDLNFYAVRVTSSQLYTLIFFICAPILIFSSPISSILWVISVSAIIIFGHALLLDKPIETAFNNSV